jgi:hypothetical protein
MGVFSIFRCWILAIKMLLEAGKSDLEEFTMFFRPGGASQLSSGHVVGGGDGSIVVSFAQQLARWYALGQRWIAANVPGGCLSVNFTLLAEEAIGLTAASTAVVALLEPSELAVVMKLREVIAKDAAPLASLRQWKEFQPLYKRGAW